ncbi:unnamed protein product [Rotaria sp. Silwood2]|nr:unnamed protein product [Rotaria sp. Silwood2]
MDQLKRALAVSQSPEGEKKKCRTAIFVDGISSNTLIELLINLANLPRLYCLILDAWSSANKSNEIYQLIFALRTLKSIKLSVDEDDISIILPIATYQRSTIKYLIIDHSFTFKELFIILSYTSELCRLKYSFLNRIDKTIHKVLPITLSNLTYLVIETCYTNFYYFETFISKIKSKLMLLYITIQSEDIEFLNAHGEFEFSLYPGGPNQFISSFWIEHKWIFEVAIIAESIHYSVRRPYKKRWFDYKNNNRFDSIELSKSNQLIIKKNKY